MHAGQAPSLCRAHRWSNRSKGPSHWVHASRCLDRRRETRRQKRGGVEIINYLPAAGAPNLVFDLAVMQTVGKHPKLYSCEADAVEYPLFIYVLFIFKLLKKICVCRGFN